MSAQIVTALAAAVTASPSNLSFARGAGIQTMNHMDPAASAPQDKEKDPVCGMDVNSASARYKALHKEREYFFCSAGCLARFKASPEKILSSGPKPMGSPPVSPLLVMPAANVAPRIREEGSRAGAQYVCPMCPEVRQVGPGPCPKCGMALDRESPVLAAKKTEYTCPMHPQIVRGEP